jgi:hypothetical protein
MQAGGSEIRNRKEDGAKMELGRVYTDEGEERPESPRDKTLGDEEKIPSLLLAPFPTWWPKLRSAVM